MFIAAKSLAEVILGRVFFGLVRVAFPMSCNTPLDCLLLIRSDPDRLVVVGETFSASETPSPLAEVDVDSGVTLRVGTAAPRKPALRSWRRRVCLELPGPDRGREGDCSLRFSASPGYVAEGESKGDSRAAMVEGHAVDYGFWCMQTARRRTNGEEYCMQGGCLSHGDSVGMVGCRIANRLLEAWLVDMCCRLLLGPRKAERQATTIRLTFIRATFSHVSCSVLDGG